MLFYAFVFLVISIGTAALGFTGVAPGTAGVFNLSLLLFFVLLTAGAVSTLRHHRRH